MRSTTDNTDSRPLEKRPTVALGKRDEDTLTTLARLERELDEAGKQEIRKLADGVSLGQMSATLLRTLDPDIVEAASRRLYSDRIAEGTEDP